MNVSPPTLTRWNPWFALAAVGASTAVLAVAVVAPAGSDAGKNPHHVRVAAPTVTEVTIEPQRIVVQATRAIALSQEPAARFPG